MPTTLEVAIDSLSDPAVSLADSLRRLLVVARRIGASEVGDWIRHELDGYAREDSVPDYRGGSHLPIRLDFVGVMMNPASRMVNRGDVPAELGDIMDSIAIRSPVAELAALAQRQGDSNPQLGFPTAWLVRFRSLVAEGKAITIEGMTLNGAAAEIPRTYLIGMLDRIRSSALDLALSIEDVSEEAGMPGGPTVATSAAVAHVVNVGLLQVYGENATFAIGQGATAVRIEEGDVESLVEAARAFLDASGVREFKSSLEEDGGEYGARTRSFLERVRSGAAGLAIGVAGNAAYSGLLQLLSMTFP